MTAWKKHSNIPFIAFIIIIYNYWEITGKKKKVLRSVYDAEKRRV